MAYTQRPRQFINGDDGGVAVALFEAADVLLAETREFSKLLLGQPSFGPEFLNIPAEDFAHVHAQRSAKYIL